MSNPHKKFKIRAPLKSVFSDHNACLKLIRKAIDVIHAKNASTLSFEEIYRSAYYLVLDSSGSTLYQAVLESFTTILKREVSHLANFIPSDNFEGEGGIGFLRLILQSWEHFRVCLKMTSDVLMYMDKMYCPQSRKPITWDAGIQLFRNEFVRSNISPVRTSIRTCLLRQIEHERNGNLVDSLLIKKILDMLLCLGDSFSDIIDARPPNVVFGETIPKGSVYSADFENSFLVATKSYYTAEAEEKLAQPIPSYLENCEKRLNEEMERCSRYLHSITLKPLILIVETTLIKDPLPKLISESIDAFFQSNAQEDLARIYRLAKRVPNGLEQLSNAISKHILSHSPRILDMLNASQEQQDEADAFMKWANEILKLHDQIRSFIHSSFQSDNSFEKVMQTALSEIMNKNPILASQAISVCIDLYLRKGIKLSEVEVETHLNRILELFSYLRDKDAFANYYNLLQSKRLLSKPSYSEDHEKFVITSLRTLCGSQYSCKFEKKLVDMANSKELSTRFIEAYTPSIDFHVDVLTSSLWPFTSQEPSIGCIFPSSLKALTTTFEDFYSSMHANRRLNWQPQWGSGEVRGYFKQTHDLTLPTFGVFILLQFNEKVSYTMEELHANTMIPESDLSRYLLSLSLGKFKILTKTPPTKQVLPTDTFEFNSEFKEKRFKLRIPLIVAAKTDQQQRAVTLAQLEEERSSVIDAVLVRIMKSRKTMPHAELMSEVIKQLSSRFLPQPHLIKRRIENLIDRDFLERSAQDTSLYIYVA